MPSVTLGNTSHTALITNTETGEKTRYKSAHIQQSVTMTGSLPDNIFAAMQAVINMWKHESDQPPAWVDSDSEPLAAALREHFGCGKKPDDWEIVITGEPRLELVEEAPEPTVEPTAVEPTTAATAPPDNLGVM